MVTDKYIRFQNDTNRYHAIMLKIKYNIDKSLTRLINMYINKFTDNVSLYNKCWTIQELSVIHSYYIVHIQ